jgi:hypothetical protein
MVEGVVQAKECQRVLVPIVVATMGVMAAAVVVTQVPTNVEAAGLMVPAGVPGMVVMVGVVVVIVGEQEMAEGVVVCHKQRAAGMTDRRATRT